MYHNGMKQMLLARWSKAYRLILQLCIEPATRSDHRWPQPHWQHVGKTGQSWNTLGQRQVTATISIATAPEALLQPTFLETTSTYLNAQAADSFNSIFFHHVCHRSLDAMVNYDKNVQGGFGCCGTHTHKLCSFDIVAPTPGKMDFDLPGRLEFTGWCVPIRQRIRTVASWTVLMSWTSTAFDLSSFAWIAFVARARGLGRVCLMGSEFLLLPVMGLPCILEHPYQNHYIYTYIYICIYIYIHIYI